MNGKIVGIVILSCALFAGAALYYLQVYGFYREATSALPEVQLVSLTSDQSETIETRAIQAIDADSSPIRFRACFETPLSLAVLSAAYVSLERATPRNAPNWFDCFDAEAIAQDLASGQAAAFLGQKNVDFGVDRIVAITQDGRGYIWHELNDCGEKAYDGTIVGEECPRLDEN
ncbi:hypothetical protein ROLI_008570 [Roseobacter fucihabitans]|uniref:Histidine kinase n=1 Tax=Roseobacter fucihabitans TaxID=1537242 RepID=A0ABZ2BR19_9RHOB|nr:DUF6446 family protein [Roseobacter litoralis]MBC6966980.1 hypothetical protein [Roseobacter litoralis]